MLFLKTILIISTLTIGTKANKCGSILDALEGDHRFDTLVDYLKYVHLDDLLDKKDDILTTLAPTNKAFTRFKTPSNKNELRSLLLYHIISDREITEHRFEEGLLETASDKCLDISFVNHDVVFNNMAEVVDFEVVGPCHGVIHAIDRVITPIPTIFDFLCNDVRFDTLCYAIKKTGLQGILDGHSIKVTLFAPSNNVSSFIYQYVNCNTISNSYLKIIGI